MTKSTAEIRQMFLDFFHGKGHQIVPSSSLVPGNDPTLLFTNAGMNQFKDVFLGKSKQEFVRATTAQRCLRAGGKHNDLDNVGYTARHHTFFEMLGNFSFGDYFKEDAINFAWELLTSRDWFNLPKDKLWVTVYATDDEAYAIWANKINIPPERIIRIGDNKGAPYASDNFWQMGDTGPCGPCTEIFYDHGDHLWGGPPGSPEEDGDRYIEIWNIVFMQFNRQVDGSMLPLPKPSVDTGMGLERIAAVIQHVNSNYDIDLFNTLIKAAAALLHKTDYTNQSLRVIADHIRSCAFLIADGVLPSNEGRGYVLRRIIRRAVRHGHMLGATTPFFYQLVPTLILVMGSVGEIIDAQRELIEGRLKAEEEQFIRTLDRGLVLLDEELSKLSGHTLSGEVVFKLYDTYGFPMDLTADICRERNLKIDEAGFEVAMEAQRARARSSSNFSVDYSSAITVEDKTTFKGYELLQHRSDVVAMYNAGVQTSELMEGDEGIVFLSQTPFYAESGGQVGDTGRLTLPNGYFLVSDTQKYGQAIGHHGKVMLGQLKLHDQVEAIVDEQRRAQIRRNHSATHLLHAALQHILGEHVTQKGSLVRPEMLRFDFSHAKAVTIEQLKAIEVLINRQICHNDLIEIKTMTLDDAKKEGAMALFGEKYEANVRVLSIGEVSIELCGGTHVDRTGDIGLFKLVAESGIAAGIRRIEAVTGDNAITLMQLDEETLTHICQSLKSDKSVVTQKLSLLHEQIKQLEKTVDYLQDKQNHQMCTQLLSNVNVVNGINVLISQVEGGNAKMLRMMVDEIKNRLKTGIIILGAAEEDKASLIVGVTKDLTSRFSANEIIRDLAVKIGGKGGGRADMAQAGGEKVGALSDTLRYAEISLLSKCE